MTLLSETTTPDSPDAAATYRDATATDYDAAAALFKTTMGDGFTLDAKQWQEVCETDGHRAFVALVGDEVVGLAVVIVSRRIRLASGLRRTRYHLDEIIISPAHRRKGYAKGLLEHVKQIASASAPSYMIVNCDFMNVAARRTYESAGLYLVRQSSDRFEVAFN